MNSQSENFWSILEKLNTAHAGLLRCLYAIKFIYKKELTDEQKDRAFRCLNVIAEDEKNTNEVRSWCYNQLGLIHSGSSDFIVVPKPTATGDAIGY